MRHRAESSWHLGIQDWAAARFGQTRQSARRGVPFGPFDAHRPERFHERPVVMLVLGQGSALPVEAFAEAVELIRIATSGFRVVLFADSHQVATRISPEWPIEQAVPEETWLAHRQENWLDAAVDHLTWAQDFYGASYVLTPRDEQEARETLSFLAWGYDAQQPVLAAALERFDRAGGGPTAVEPTGFRWGWGAVEPGHHVRSFVSGEGARVDAHVFRGEGPGALVGRVGAVSDELLEQARRAGWSTAQITPYDVGPASQTGFVGGVFRACGDALRAGGLVLATSAGAESVPGVAEYDGVLDQEEGGGWSLHLDGVSRLRFREETAREVFAAVTRICGGRVG